jgi:hypothetical protein
MLYLNGSSRKKEKQKCHDKCRLEYPNDDEQIDSIALAVQSEGQVSLATIFFVFLLPSLHVYTAAIFG